MKVYKAFAFLSIFIILFYNCSLPADDEEKGELEGGEDTFTPELPWRFRGRGYSYLRTSLGRRDGQIHHQF